MSERDPSSRLPGAVAHRSGGRVSGAVDCRLTGIGRVPLATAAGGPRRSLRRHPMVIQEAVLAGCLAMVLAGLGLEMGARVWRYGTGAAEFAQMSQEASALRPVWREFVRGCPVRPVGADGGGLAAGDWRATIGPQGLDLQRGAAHKHFRLPAGMSARIEREGAASERERWTLVLSWTGRRRGEADPRTGATRIVACRGDRVP